MKRFAPVLLVLLACLVWAPVVLAQPSRGCDPGGWQPGDGSQFSAVGTVSVTPVADGSGGGTISVAVDHGCPNLGGSTITVIVADDAQLFSVAGCQKSAIDFSAISQGDKVALCGTIDSSSGSPVYTASRVNVRVPSFACVGTVSVTPVADGSGGGTISVAVDHGCPNLGGSTITVIVADDAQLFSVAGCQKSAIDFSAISQGDKVALCGTIDSSSGSPVYTASRVNVRVPSFACVGTVSVTPVADGSGGGTISVAVDHGCPNLGGSTITVIVADDAQLFSVAGCQKSAIDFSAISQGDKVALCGTIDSSSGSPVYTASAVLDGVSGQWQPRPFCRPGAAREHGSAVRLGLRVSDSMPGCSSATVALTLTTLSGRKLASTTLGGVSLNKTASVSFRLSHHLAKGRYRILARATDAAGNRQLKVASAMLRVG